MYKYYNANPYNRHIDDCVIRSISTLTGRDWEDVFEELSDLASDVGYMFENVPFVEDYLDKRYPRECHYSKTLKEFVEEHPIGRYAVTMDGHITAVIDGVVYDTFNPLNRIIRCVWRM